MHTIHHKGATIAYEDLGTGSPLLFLHCSSASHREWRYAAKKLSDRYRCLLPDFLGYGETSQQFDEIGRAIPCRDVDIIAEMAAIAGEPVDIVAHSYGAAIALEYAAEHPEQVRSVFAVEPVSFHYLKDAAGSADWRRIEQLASDIVDAESMGQSRISARHYMSFWLGRIRWWLAPRRFRSQVVKTMPKVAFEFSLLSELQADTRKLAAFDRQTTLVSGTRSPRPALAVIEKLMTALPNSQRFTIKHAGHMMPFTHPKRVLGLIEQHLSA